MILFLTVYCFLACSKKDTKRHKKVCSKLAFAVQTSHLDPSKNPLDLSDQENPLLMKHIYSLVSECKPLNAGIMARGGWGGGAGFGF